MLPISTGNGIQMEQKINGNGTGMERKRKVVRRSQDTYDRACTEAIECRLKRGQLGTEKGAKLSPKATKMLPRSSQKGAKSHQGTVWTAAGAKREIRLSKLSEFVPQAGTEKGPNNLIRPSFRHPVVPKGPARAYFWEVGKLTQEIPQYLSQTDAGCTPQNSVST